MVFDTVVFAYALLGVSEFREEAAEALDAAEEIWVPDSICAELLNVIWQWIQFRNIPQATGFEVLDDVESLWTEIIPTRSLWKDALELAIKRGHSAYDTVFIALAIAKATKVVTYDQKLLQTFPEWTLTPKQFLDDR